MVLPKALPQSLFVQSTIWGQGTGLSSGPTGATRAPQVTADQGELLPTWLVGWKGGPAGAGMACRVCKACKAWSAFVQEICEGNVKQLLKAGPGSHRNRYGLLLRRADSRQGLDREIDR